MTEFQELVKNAPSFESMEHGELVAYAYAMFAAGTMADAENAKLRELGKQYELVIVDYRAEVAELRELVRDMWQELDALVPYYPHDHDGLDEYRDRMRELGVDE